MNGAEVVRLLLLVAWSLLLMATAFWIVARSFERDESPLFRFAYLFVGGAMLILWRVFERIERVDDLDLRVRWRDDLHVLLRVNWRPVRLVRPGRMDAGARFRLITAEDAGIGTERVASTLTLEKRTA